LNIDEYAVVVQPLAVHLKRVANIEVIHPNDGLAPRDRSVSTVFTRDCDGVLVTPEPCLVMRKMFEIDVVEDSVGCILAEVIDVEETVKVTMITQTTRPL